ncbi:hypothetical protein NGRA_0762 [Nosema granulosis]|uniref:Uncharacterized protein n=1 Tax=Nosema granulosis TaxID=83296 RepID=A0A9P6H090_9MICR|nr:hypothetical protein NGRA_0762 [Nosema granulosis]
MYKKITILRDPSTVELRFLEGQPVELEKILTKEEWDSTISEVNEAMRDKISFSYFFLFLFGLPEKEIDKTVEKINLEFGERGIYFCNPKSLQFQEMEIILNLHK